MPTWQGAPPTRMYADHSMGIGQKQYQPIENNMYGQVQRSAKKQYGYNYHQMANNAVFPVEGDQPAHFTTKHSPQRKDNFEHMIRKPGESPNHDTRIMHPHQKKAMSYETENRGRYVGDVYQNIQADVPEFQQKKAMRKKALDAPYERGQREQLVGMRMEVKQPQGVRGEEEHFKNENYPQNSSQFGPGAPEKLQFYDKGQFVLRQRGTLVKEEQAKDANIAEQLARNKAAGEQHVNLAGPGEIYNKQPKENYHQPRRSDPQEYEQRHETIPTYAPRHSPRNDQYQYQEESAGQREEARHLQPNHAIGDISNGKGNMMSDAEYYEYILSKQQMDTNSGYRQPVDSSMNKNSAAGMNSDVMNIAQDHLKSLSQPHQASVMAEQQLKRELDERQKYVSMRQSQDEGMMPPVNINYKGLQSSPPRTQENLRKLANNAQNMGIPYTAINANNMQDVQKERQWREQTLEGPSYNPVQHEAARHISGGDVELQRHIQRQQDANARQKIATDNYVKNTLNGYNRHGSGGILKKPLGMQHEPVRRSESELRYDHPQPQQLAPTENRVYMPTGMDKQTIDPAIMHSPYFQHGMKAQQLRQSPNRNPQSLAASVVPMGLGAIPQHPAARMKVNYNDVPFNEVRVGSGIHHLTGSVPVPYV